MLNTAKFRESQRKNYRKVFNSSSEGIESDKRAGFIKRMVEDMPIITFEDLENAQKALKEKGFRKQHDNITTIIEAKRPHQNLPRNKIFANQIIEAFEDTEAVKEELAKIEAVATLISKCSNIIVISNDVDAFRKRNSSIL